MNPGIKTIKTLRSPIGMVIPRYIYLFHERGEKTQKMIEKEYRFNANFRRYVDRYAENHGITVEEALEHAMVREAFQYYREV